MAAILRSLTPARAHLALDDLQGVFAVRSLRTRNTFIDTPAERSPSLAGFYQERLVQSCPPARIGLLTDAFREVCMEKDDADVMSLDTSTDGEQRCSAHSDGTDTPTTGSLQEEVLTPYSFGIARTLTFEEAFAVPPPRRAVLSLAEALGEPSEERAAAGIFCGGASVEVDAAGAGSRSDGELACEMYTMAFQCGQFAAWEHGGSLCEGPMWGTVGAAGMAIYPQHQAAPITAGPALEVVPAYFGGALAMNGYLQDPQAMLSMGYLVPAAPLAALPQPQSPPIGYDMATPPSWAMQPPTEAAASLGASPAALPDVVHQAPSPPPPPPPSRPALGMPEMPSMGSAGHADGTCNPCAFFHKAQCENGVACQFCHLCDADARKRRRKEKLESRRMAEKTVQQRVG